MSKRKFAWWDCLYTPKEIKLKPGDWDFSNNKGPTKYKFDASTLEAFQKKIGKQGGISFWNISFDTCDFSGDFEHGGIKFKNCKFVNCDFGSESTWLKAKFNHCSFSRCSFTLSEFRDCFFYECEWKEITFNGSTKLINTLVSDSYGLVDFDYTFNQDRDLWSGRFWVHKFRCCCS